ncbi:porin [Solimonas sp. K1W22B-7]|nr:porin [Solimonas sp. K1W22B-7]
MGAVATPAMADKAETTGGLKIKTDDGRFEMAIGGRIHFDAYIFDQDEDALFGSSSFNGKGGAAFRRTYLTLTGKAYGWKYKFENDFSAMGGSTTCDAVAAVPATPTCSTSNTGASGFRELWVSTNLGPGEIVIGQFKPFRGMEELTSSNELTMIERPVTSASGIYAGRQFLMGVGYKGLIADQFGYGIDVMNLGAANSTTEGLSYGARAYWFPISTATQTIHAGLSYSVDSEAIGSIDAARPAFNYAGRRGPQIRFAEAGRAFAEADRYGDQSTWAAELGTSFGPFTAQAEYAKGKLDDAFGTAAAPEDADVTAYYVQASWMITGESKPYKKDRGAFGNPKPNGAYGAWEATARYEMMESDDESGTNTLCRFASNGSGGVVIPGAAAGADQCELTQLTLGANWYLNPNVRFMLNYYMAELDLGGTAGKDEPEAWTLRTQFSF